MQSIYSLYNNNEDVYRWIFATAVILPGWHGIAMLYNVNDYIVDLSGKSWWFDDNDDITVLVTS